MRSLRSRPFSAVTDKHSALTGAVVEVSAVTLAARSSGARRGWAQRRGSCTGSLRSYVLVARRFQVRTYPAHARRISATEAEVRLVPKFLAVPRRIASWRQAVRPIVDRRSIRIRCAVISISLRKSRGSDRGGQNYHRAEQFHSHLHSPQTTQINRSVLAPVPGISNRF
jgi:hypothetical protein